MTEYCRCDPGRAGALLQELGLVSDQHADGVNRLASHQLTTDLSGRPGNIEMNPALQRESS